MQFYKYEDVEGEGKNRNQAWENTEEKGLKERYNSIMMKVQNCYNISLWLLMVRNDRERIQY